MPNRSTYFPSVICDGFFEEPNLIREYALSLDYTETAPRVPGVRTKCLSEINPKLFSTIVNRYLTLYFSREDMKKVRWNANVNFQLIDKKYKKGWIHKDNKSGCKATGIIYLDPNPNPESGTSLFTAIDGVTQKHDDIKESFFNDEISEEEAEKSRIENNEQFQEVVNCKNQYNRLFGFAAENWHAANEFKTKDDNSSRLTVVIFLNEINLEYPTQRLMSA